ncbi:MAG: copper-binding protein [Burkholderiales bacterium]|jgi:Cu/Ag efflux protein CusF|nr:copper-binding protein [Burkholderiales bacterium]
MKKTIAALAVLLAATLPAMAQPKADDHAAHHAPAAADMSEGEVRKVDKGAGKITLKHGEIKSLDMPPMTMVFGVKDPALLDQVKPGDKVLFKAVNEAGKFTISNLQVVK